MGLVIEKSHHGLKYLNHDHDSANDSRYLLLDASNGPVTAGLGIVGSADEVQLTVKANATQTANIFENQLSDTTVVSGFDERGILFSDGGTDPTNTFVGADVGNLTLTGVANICIGERSFTAATSASQNTAIGSLALSACTDGEKNFALGRQTLQSVTTGDFSIAIGYQAVSASNCGYQIAIGGAALSKASALTGHNIGIGHNSLITATLATKTIAIGGFTGRFQTTGIGSVYIGYFSGAGSGARSYNTVIGNESGNKLTTGSSNNFFGAYAGYRQTTLSNLLIIDNQQRADIATELTNSILYGVMAATPAAQTLRINANLHLPETTTPTPITNYGAIYPKADNKLYFQDGAGEEHVVHGNPFFMNESATTQGLGANPDLCVFGYYDFALLDANLSEASTTQTYGTANVSYAAHAFIVSGGAGSVTGGGVVGLRVNGTSITDAGVRTTSDTETIVADITASTLDEYVEGKKWLGTITFELFVVSGTPSAYSFDFNYGLSKYEDFMNNDFDVTDVQVTGFAGASDNDVNFTLYHHDPLGTWVYAATGFSPWHASREIASLVSDHSTDDKLANNDNFAWKRTGLSQAIVGSGSEGVIGRIESSANNAIEFLNFRIGAQY